MTASATASATTSTRWVGPVASAVALASATAYTYVRNPFETGAFPVCLLYAGTGIYCPGCGGLRAVHQLLHGDVAGALSLNALAIVVIIPVTLVALVWWGGNTVGLNWRAPRFHPAVYWALVGLVAGFWLLRNIGPFATYLAP
ncbi:DUF2752 domain-containing protein [Demequina sp.]|uniref:DUF2752 domain-containing protein n=1 Tax=Demequina sp. TaxID=2050685 RepID=UPI003D1300C7